MAAMFKSYGRALIIVGAALTGGLSSASITNASSLTTNPRSISAVDNSPAAECGNKVWLTTHEIEGYPWQKHRHWLEAPIPISTVYVIVNLRDYHGYQWDFWGNFDGHARFGVPTPYTYLEPWWIIDPWLLVYC